MQRQLWRHNPHLATQPAQSPSSPICYQASLEIVRGQARQRIRPILNPTFLIGVAEDCDLVLGDPQFPEAHAYLRFFEGQLTLRHLGFAPPVTVNGKVVGQTQLADGDRIRTGPYEFLVCLQPLESGEDRSDRLLPLRVPASLDRVEDEVGSLLVQRLLKEIRSEMFSQPAHLKLFVAPEQTPSPPTDSPRPEASGQEQRHSYARSS